MNGLAKASGIFSILAGIVFIVAIVFGIKDGLSITDNCLEDFVVIENFKTLALISGLLAIIAGYASIGAGVVKKNAAQSVYGIFLVLLGVLIATLGYKDDFNSLSWEHIEILLIAGIVAAACTCALARAKDRRFALADVAIVLAFIIVILFALKMNMLTFVVGMIVIIILGILSVSSAKPKAQAEDEEEEVEEEAAEERVITPAAAPVAAAPPAEKPAAEEQPAEAAPAEKPAAKPAAAAEAKPAEKPAEAAPAAAEAKPAEPAPAEKPAEAAPAAAVAAAAAPAAEEPAEESSAADDLGLSDEDLGLIPDTPSGFVRRACWNKGLRCRKDYGPCVIPFAFVKSKVAVYIDGATADTSNDAKLQDDAWVVLHFKEADVTDGQAEAEVIHAAVKENTKALKKSKAKKKR